MLTTSIKDATSGERGRSSELITSFTVCEVRALQTCYESPTSKVSRVCGAARKLKYRRRKLFMLFQRLLNIS